MSFLERPKEHDQKDMRFFKDIATLRAEHVHYSQAQADTQPAGAAAGCLRPAPHSLAPPPFRVGVVPR